MFRQISCGLHILGIVQAYQGLNDPQFVEAARGFAARILSEGGSNPRDRIEYGFRLATSRKPTGSERSVLEEVLKRQIAEYKKDPAAAEKLLSVGSFKPVREFDKAELAAWCEVASMLLNLDEALTKG